MSLFRTLWGNFNKIYCVSDDLATKWQTVVESKYSEEQRHYHTIHHVEHMCSLLQKYSQHIKDNGSVFYATVFHDVIYDPKSRDNEERSEDLFQEFAKDANLQKHTVAAVSSMILLTKQHLTEVHQTPDRYGNDDHHYFLDFDMAILGSSPQDYMIYTDQIRQEYIHVPDDLFQKGRITVLQDFSKTPNIFATKELRTDLEEQSRLNIQEEINKLENQTL